MHGYRMVVRMNVRFHMKNSPAVWPVCAAPGWVPGLQPRRLVSGQFSIIRDSPDPANMIYMRAGIRLDARSCGNDSGARRRNDTITDLPGGGGNADAIEKNELHEANFIARVCCTDFGLLRFCRAGASTGAR